MTKLPSAASCQATGAASNSATGWGVPPASTSTRPRRVAVCACSPRGAGAAGAACVGRLRVGKLPPAPQLVSMTLREKAAASRASARADGGKGRRGGPDAGGESCRPEVQVCGAILVQAARNPDAPAQRDRSGAMRQEPPGGGLHRALRANPPRQKDTRCLWAGWDGLGGQARKPQARRAGTKAKAGWRGAVRDRCENRMAITCLMAAIESERRWRGRRRAPEGRTVRQARREEAVAGGQNGRSRQCQKEKAWAAQGGGFELSALSQPFRRLWRHLGNHKAGL
jgi:hypothetical protein